MAVRRQPRFEIRRMRPQDLDEILQIERACFRHPWSAEMFRRELEHDWSTIMVAMEPVPPEERPPHPPGKGAESDKWRITGFLIYWNVHDEVHVLNLAVRPEHRRRGVARALMMEASARGRANGAALLTLEVRRTNEAALELYRTLGFRAVGIRPNYYADEHEDAIVMVRDL
jgi:ribosomal-protein-alanine N-acetyltransferase